MRYAKSGAQPANVTPLRRQWVEMSALLLVFSVLPFLVFAQIDKTTTQDVAGRSGTTPYLESEVRNAIYLKRWDSIPDNKLRAALEYFKHAVELNKATMAVSLENHDHETASYILQHMADQWDHWAELAQVAKVRAAHDDAAAEYRNLMDRYNELVRQHNSLLTSYRQAATSAAIVPMEYPSPSMLNCSTATIDLGDGITTTRMSCR
jgi:hypothetical protein